MVGAEQTPPAGQLIIIGLVVAVVVGIGVLLTVTRDTIRVGNSPIWVAVSPDGRRAYITDFRSDSVSVIDTATDTVIAAISVGVGPRGVVVSPDGHRAYVVNYRSGTVSVINIG